MKKQKVIIKVFNSKLEVKEADNKKTIEAYVSIFDNIDYANDIIVKGAFSDSIKNKLPAGVWMHNWEKPIAKTLEAREDEKGLYIKAEFIDGIQQAEEAYKLIKEGVVSEFSIGFMAEGYSFDKENHRIIEKATLFEWSPVIAGANPDTELVSIKARKEKEEKEKKTPACRMTDETAQECVSRKVAELVKEGYESDEALAIAQKNCEISCDDQGKEDEEEEDDEKKTEIEEKSGRVLSGKNRDLIKAVMEELESLSKTIKNTISPLKSLYDASEGAPDNTDKGKGRQPMSSDKILRIRQNLKKIDKVSEYLLKITKK